MAFLRSAAMPLVIVGIAAIVQLNGGIGVPMSFAEVEPYQDRLKFAFLIAFKRYQYASLAILEAVRVALGFSQPLIAFQVLKDPPSIFINWEVIPEKREEFKTMIGLPKWLEMKPISIIEGEEARYFVSCNIYEVTGLSGLLNGFRAEWSIYAGKPDGSASFLVVEARHSSFSQDSVNGFVLGTPLEHAKDDGTVTSFVQFDEKTSLRSVIPIDRSDNNLLRVHLSREMVAANDLIYWKNGVADRVFYNGDMLNERLVSVDPSKVLIEDSTYFASFLKTTPFSVLVFENGINFVVTPWYNLDKP